MCVSIPISQDILFQIVNAKTMLEKIKKETKSINLTIFLMRLLGLWPTSTAKEKLQANFALGMMMLSMTVASLCEAQDLFFSRKNILLLTYAAPCAVVVVSEYWKLLVFVRNRNQVMRLNSFVEKSFWRAEYDAEETEMFNDCDRLIFKTILVYVSLLQGICWHYLLVPGIESLGKNSSDRALPFPVYIDPQFYEDPYYLITYGFEVFGTMATCLCTTAFASYLFALNVSTATQFKLLQRELRQLCDFPDGHSKRRQYEAHDKLKGCIRRHQALINVADQVEELFCFVMLGQVFCSVTQICFSGFQLILTETTTFQRTMLSAEYLMASFAQLYFYCYSSHEIFIESENVSEAAYSTKWYKITDPTIHKDFALSIEIMVNRARRPCILTVGKFCPLTLETYSSVVRSSMSYFTVLRQTIE